MFWKIHYNPIPLHITPEDEEKYIQFKDGEIVGEGFDDKGYFIYRMFNGERKLERIQHIIDKEDGALINDVVKTAAKIETKTP